MKEACHVSAARSLALSFSSCSQALSGLRVRPVRPRLSDADLRLDSKARRRLSLPALIHFDDLPANTIIENSYQAAYGVRFENLKHTRAIIYGNDPATARSRPNVASNDAVSPETSANVPMGIAFDTPQEYVGFYIGNGETLGPAALMRGYDAAGAIVCEQRYAPVPEPHTQFLGFHDSLGQIVRIIARLR
jgi:hypothetical protein